MGKKTDYQIILENRERERYLNIKYNVIRYLMNHVAFWPCMAAASHWANGLMQCNYNARQPSTSFLLLEGGCLIF